MSASTEEVFDRHLQAFGAGDVERLLADYTEDSFVIGPTGVIKGLAGLRGFSSKPAGSSRVPVRSSPFSRG